MADLAKEVPGFAGYTVDRQRGILNIRATSPGFNAEALRAAMRKRQPAIDPSLLELEFKVIAAHWDYADLNEWYIQAQDAIFPLPTQYFEDFVLFDLDEGGNYIVFAFSTEEARSWAQEQIDALQLPEGVVKIVVSQPAVPH